VLQQQHDAGGEVADDVLQGEAERDGGQAEAADQHPEVDPEDRQGDQQADGHDGEVGQLADQQLDVGLGGGAAQRPGDPAPDHPGDQHGHH
jgi:hypothetical protein